jgi:hypothetical protein
LSSYSTMSTSLCRAPDRVSLRRLGGHWRA